MYTIVTIWLTGFVVLYVYYRLESLVREPNELIVEFALWPFCFMISIYLITYRFFHAKYFNSNS